MPIKLIQKLMCPSSRLQVTYLWERKVWEAIVFKGDWQNCTVTETCKDPAHCASKTCAVMASRHYLFMKKFTL